MKFSGGHESIEDCYLSGSVQFEMLHKSVVREKYGLSIFTPVIQPRSVNLESLNQGKRNILKEWCIWVYITGDLFSFVSLRELIIDSYNNNQRSARPHFFLTQLAQSDIRSNQSVSHSELPYLISNLAPNPGGHWMRITTKLWNSRWYSCACTE